MAGQVIEKMFVFFLGWELGIDLRMLHHTSESAEQ